jgi:hypothetical protein
LIWHKSQTDFGTKARIERCAQIKTLPLTGQEHIGEIYGIVYFLLTVAGAHAFFSSICITCSFLFYLSL